MDNSSKRIWALSILFPIISILSFIVYYFNGGFWEFIFGILTGVAGLFFFSEYKRALEQALFHYGINKKRYVGFILICYLVILFSVIKGALSILNFEPYLNYRP